jgi:hypothetical protein
MGNDRGSSALPTKSRIGRLVPRRLVASKVRCSWNLSAAPHLGERLESARPRRQGTSRRKTGFHPKLPFILADPQPRPGNKQGTGPWCRLIGTVLAPDILSAHPQRHRESRPRICSVSHQRLRRPPLRTRSRFQSALRYLIPRYETFQGFCRFRAILRAARGRFAAGGPLRCHPPSPSSSDDPVRMPGNRLLHRPWAGRCGHKRPWFDGA